MSNLDDIVQRVVVEGTGEAGATLEELGRIGAAAFEAIEVAATATNGAFSLMSGGTLAVIGAIIAVVATLAKLVDSSADAVISFEALGSAMGVSAGSAQGLSQAFKEVGIEFESFARMMERGAQRIAQGWENIQEEVTNSATKIEGAQIQVKESHLAVEEAMQRAQFASAEWKDKLESDALAVADAYKKVARESSDASSQAEHDASSVKSAEFSLAADEARLRELRTGEKEDPQKKINRETLQQYQKVEDDKQRITDAKNKETNDARDQADRQKKDALAVREAELKQARDRAGAGTALDRADLGVQKAQNSAAEAINKLASTNTKDLQNILAAINQGNIQQALRAAPQAVARALELKAGQESKTGTPEVTDSLKVFFDFIRKFGDQMTGAQQQAVGRDMFGGRPREVADMLEKTKTASGADLEAIIEKFAKAISQQQLDTAHGIKQTEGEISGTASRVTHDVALGGTQAVTDDVKKTAGEVKSVVDEVVDDFHKLTAALAAAYDWSNRPLPPKEDRAGGGYVTGPGSATSDSIPANLSNGEFVMKAAAVRAYGTDFMHSINDLAANGFSMGGYVSSFRPARFADGGLVGAGGGGHPVNLHIDGNTFQMRAAQGVARELQNFAVSRQMGSTGRRPSWVR